MKPKTLVLMVVAIVCGLAASYMTSRVIADRNNKEGDEEKVAVLVAKKNLTLGTLIKEPEQLFEEKLFTEGEEPKKAIKSFEELKDRRLNKPLSAEQFVTPDDLNGKDQDGLAGMMQKGKRAVALKVNIDGVVAGFVLPHSRVDVISVIRRNEQESYAKIILQNVLVLAVDQQQVRPDDKAALPSSTVTVQVTPAEAEKLALATELGGPLRLILRSFGDEDTVATTGAMPKGLIQGSSKPEDSNGQNENESGSTRAPVASAPKVPNVPPTPVVEAKQPEPPPAKTHTMMIYNGDNVTKAIFVLPDQDHEASMKVEKSQPDPAPAVPAVPLPPGLTGIPIPTPIPVPAPAAGLPPVAVQAPTINTAPRLPVAKS
jgi:pilus assembly protein CpaB